MYDRPVKADALRLKTTDLMSVGGLSDRPTVADIRVLKEKRKLSMLFVHSLEEADAANQADIDMICVAAANWSSKMREAAGG